MQEAGLNPPLFLIANAKVQTANCKLKNANSNANANANANVKVQIENANANSKLDHNTRFFVRKSHIPPGVDSTGGRPPRCRAYHGL